MESEAPELLYLQVTLLPACLSVCVSVLQLAKQPIRAQEQDLVGVAADVSG